MNEFPSKLVEANGLRLHVTDVGSGTPVVLLHGFPDTRRVWRRQVQPLVDAGYRVIVPDQRGCGDSDMPTAVSAYRLDKLADDIAALLDALGISEPAHLVGHDWGAMVGWKLAVDHAPRFASFMVMSVGHPLEYRRSIEQQLRAWYIGVFLLRGFSERLLRAGDWRALRKLSLDAEDADARVAALARPGRLTAGLSWYRANAMSILTQPFAKTSLPVFGLWSDGDFALAEGQMRNSQRQVTGPWRYQRIEKASHWLQLESADTINALMLEWFASPRA
ncbi:alpha/beta fold hydrolase [Solimonas marina]|uniref:Alpha/beta fold hydrolase n=1 Tax=Solimonas marina TaxID=2714601 RepID=A0A969WFB3_9GAMM|nr:alpha/beta fold hydrolase [Solimonas marina]NKF24271.1 alpha/beta fold hydrolase [Solimonas marina]